MRQASTNISNLEAKWDMQREQQLSPTEEPATPSVKTSLVGHCGRCMIAKSFSPP